MSENSTYESWVNKISVASSLEAIVTILKPNVYLLFVVSDQGVLMWRLILPHNLPSYLSSHSSFPFPMFFLYLISFCHPVSKGADTKQLSVGKGLGPAKADH